jgi:fructose-specific phosphotransferase system IIC component
MYKEALRSIEGIQIYPIISLAIFGLFFISLIIWVIRVDKEYIAKMSNLPILDKQDTKSMKGEISHV